jgi:hypothetical protein
VLGLRGGGLRLLLRAPPGGLLARDTILLREPGPLGPLALGSLGSDALGLPLLGSRLLLGGALGRHPLLPLATRSLLRRCPIGHRCAAGRLAPPPTPGGLAADQAHGERQRDARDQQARGDAATTALGGRVHDLPLPVVSSGRRIRQGESVAADRQHGAAHHHAD